MKQCPAGSPGSILLIVAAGLLAAFFLHKSGGNLWYGGTILWALAGIGVRNQFELRNIRLATIAWLLLAAFGFLIWSSSLAMGRQSAADVTSNPID